MCRMVCSQFVFLAAVITAAQAQPGKPPIGPGPGGPIPGLNQGMGKFSLAAQKSVQEDLKLSEDQTKKIGEMQEKIVMLQKELGKDPKALTKYTEAMQENDKALTELLKKEQLTRLEQIQFQQKGGMALLDAKVQEKIKFSKEQLEKSQDVLKDMGKAMQDLIKPGGPMPPDLKELPKKLEALQKDAGDKLIKLLTDDQQKIWKEMTGEPFKGKIEPQTFPAFPIPGGPGGLPGGPGGLPGGSGGPGGPKPPQRP